MRNRNFILFVSVLFVALLAVGCGNTRVITQQENDKFNALNNQINAAIKQDAKTCAPKELAAAQANLSQARLECTQNWESCDNYTATAGKSVDALMAKIKECEEKAKIPTCGLVAQPETIAPGQCSTLKWNGENVTKIVWGSDESDKKAEVAPLSGSKQVCPKETTDFQMSCVGKWSTNYEAVTVTVAAPAAKPAPAPAPAPVAAPAQQKIALRVNFDFAKYVIRPADLAELQKGVQFLQNNPGAKLSIVGHTDNIGSDAFNQRLSEQRAAAVQKFLEGEVEIKEGTITSSGRSFHEPIADNRTPEGRFQNRRVEIQIVK